MSVANPVNVHVDNAGVDRLAGELPLWITGRVEKLKHGLVAVLVRRLFRNARATLEPRICSRSSASRCRAAMPSRRTSVRLQTRKPPRVPPNASLQVKEPK